MSTPLTHKEVSHTEGPWLIVQNGFTFTIGTEKTGNVKGNHDYTVATIEGSSYKDAANACLIYAAPDLLSACVAMLAKLDGMTSSEFANGGERAERIAMQAAVNKATGV